MISVVEKDREKRVMMDICKRSPFGCKIASIARAYGFDKRFSMFWIDGRQETVYCLVDGTMMITGTIVDAREALSFIRFSGAREITCALRNLEILGLASDEAGDILRKEIEGERRAAASCEEAPIREIYALLEEAGMIKEENEDDDTFEAFYLDLSHRLRHGVANVVTERIEGILAGCAVISAILESTAILSAVAVREPFRGKGIGTHLVQQAEALLSGRMVYIYKESDKKELFYQKLGFTKADSWVRKSLVRSI